MAASDLTVLGERVRVEKCPACASVGRSFYWRTVKGWRLCRCRMCGMVYAEAMPPPEALRIAYSLPRERYDAFFQTQDIDSSYILGGAAVWQQERAVAYLKEFEALLGKAGSILEIGAGSGHFLACAQSRGWRTAGVDPGNWVHDAARDGLLGIKRCGLEGADFRPGSFDAVFLSSVLEHLADPGSMLRACNALLRPGGVIMIAGLPNVGSITIRIGVDRWIGNHPPLHLQYFSARPIRVLLDACGFCRIRTKCHGLPETILEAVFNRGGKKYTGSYSAFVYDRTVRGVLVRMVRWIVYAGLDALQLGSVLDVSARKAS